jgi:hypothetical protein
MYFFNSVLTQILKMKASFFRIFYFKISQIFENFKFNRSVFGEPISFVGFHENRPVFIGK